MSLGTTRLSSPSPSPARIWIIAGSDSGGGAGIQADLKTVQQLRAHGMTVVTAVTAQNSQGVMGFEAVSETMLKQQWEALRHDMPPDAIKTGMLATPATIALVAEALAHHPHVPYVCDPVFIATSGDALGRGDVVGAMRQHLLPRAQVITPNIPEAECLAGMSIRDTADMQRAAALLRSLGAQAVYLKGGHLDSEQVHDFFTDGERCFWLNTPRVPGQFHGTGCTLASAIAAGLGSGLPLAESVVRAQAYVAMAVRDHYRPGAGAAFLGHGAWPEGAHALFPTLSSSPLRSPPPVFPRIDTGPLGFYPIVDRASWLERLLPVGVRTIQLRIKDLTGEALAEEIQRAVHLARPYGARLFINDHWQLAMRYQAYGVHLGQEDLATADLALIAQAGLRLGLSSHSYEEAARAHAHHPSYLALGPIFPTNTKKMPWQAQGLSRIREWQQLFPYPIVAIGGLTLTHAASVLAQGADGIAVITDLSLHPQPSERAAAWLAVMQPQGMG